MAHFYHVWADGDWEPPSREHVDALGQAAFPDSLYIGITGTPENRDAVRDWFHSRLGEITIVAEADSGFEQVTLEALHAWAKEQDFGVPVLYAHTKGSYHPDVQQELWRQNMTHHLVANWRDRVAELESGAFDVVGCHWWVRGYRDVPSPVFAGNFWWATCGYITGLPAVGQDERHDAEFWIGLNNPRMKALCPPELTISSFGFKWNYFQKQWVREYRG